MKSQRPAPRPAPARGGIDAFVRSAAALAVSAVVTFWVLTAFAALVGGSRSPHEVAGGIGGDIATVTLAGVGDGRADSTRSALAQRRIAGVVLDAALARSKVGTRVTVRRLRRAAAEAGAPAPLIALAPRPREGAMLADRPAGLARPSQVGQARGARLREDGIALDLQPLAVRGDVDCGYAQGVVRGGSVPMLGAVPGRAARAIVACARRLKVLPLAVQVEPRQPAVARALVARMVQRNRNVLIVSTALPSGKRLGAALEAALNAGAQLILVERASDAGRIGALARDDQRLAGRLAAAAAAVRRWLPLIPPPGTVPRPPSSRPPRETTAPEVPRLPAYPNQGGGEPTTGAGEVPRLPAYRTSGPSLR